MSTYALSLAMTLTNTVLDHTVLITHLVSVMHLMVLALELPPPGMTPAEQFCRAIKKDKDHYSEFNDENQFDNFRRVTESVARTHGTMNVLTPTLSSRSELIKLKFDLFRVQTRLHVLCLRR